MGAQIPWSLIRASIKTFPRALFVPLNGAPQRARELAFKECVVCRDVCSLGINLAEQVFTRSA